MAYPRFAAREAVFHKRNAGHNVRHFDYTGELFYFRGQCTKQPCLHGYLVTAARGGYVPVAHVLHRPKRSVDQIYRCLAVLQA